VKKAILVILITLALVACDKREDFPPMFSVVNPPQPYNLSVTQPTSTTYDITWDIDDPDQIVKEYWVYLVTGLGPPDTIGTTPSTSFTWSTPFSVSGLLFGVTSVTDQNVESNMSTVQAP